MSALELMVLAWIAVGCAQEMDNQRRVQPQESAAFFEDRVATRPLPEHVVPTGPPHMVLPERSAADTDPGYRTGRVDGQLLERVPASLAERLTYTELLRLGQKRFAISCVPCHDATGSGNGIVAQRGFPFPPTYHSERLRAKPLGYFFAVATEGKGQMPPYGDLVDLDERWAVAAYVRALQLSQFAPAGVLNEDDRQHLEDAK